MRIAVIWVRQGKAYLPTQAQTEAGYFMGIEPIYISARSKEATFLSLRNFTGYDFRKYSENSFSFTVTVRSDDGSE